MDTKLTNFNTCCDPLCTAVDVVPSSKIHRLLLRARLPVSEVSGRQHLRSASHRKLHFPRFRHSTFGTRSFSVAGPTVWNSLPDSLRDRAVEFWTF